MNKVEKFDIFLKNIMTAGDLVALVDDLNEINKLLYITGGQKLSQRVKGKVSEDVYEAVSILEKEGVLPAEPSKAEDYLGELLVYLQKIPRVALTIAFEPSTEFIRQIYDWFEKISPKKVVLDLRTRREIVAGAIIEYNGKYKDYSKTALMEEVLSGLS